MNDDITLANRVRGVLRREFWVAAGWASDEKPSDPAVEYLTGQIVDEVRRTP